MQLYWMILWILLAAGPAEAKRVLMPKPSSANNPLALSQSELRSLGERVGTDLVKCKGFPVSNRYYVKVWNKTGMTLDTDPVKAGLNRPLFEMIGMANSVRIDAELKFREWKTGKFVFTYSLEATAYVGVEKLCTVIHRTVRKREKK